MTQHVDEGSAAAATGSTGRRLAGIVVAVGALRPVAGEVPLSAEQAADALGLVESARRQFIELFLGGRMAADGSVELRLRQELQFVLDRDNVARLGPTLKAKVSANELRVHSGWKVNANTIDRITSEGDSVRVVGHRGPFSGSERFAC